MIGSGALLGIVVAIGALVLAVRGLRSHRLGFERTAAMAVAWIVIILLLVAILRAFGA